MHASSLRSRAITGGVGDMAKITHDIEKTKQLMGALVRMKPKPHEEMKVGKKAKKTKKAVVRKTKP
jgi:hypothetical protein